MTRHSLRTLIELARARTDETARQLGRLTAQERAVEERLKLLTAYRAQYQSRLMTSVREGLSYAALQNYRAFMDTLDRAIAQCRDQLAAARARRQAGQAQWHDKRRELKSFETLDERARRVEQAKNARAEQRQLDERAARALIFPSTDPTE